MKLQEFMNDDTCQILFAIIIGIVVCYFIFGSGSSGSCNRDGFSVGATCDTYFDEMITDCDEGDGNLTEADLNPDFITDRCAQAVNSYTMGGRTNCVLDQLGSIDRLRVQEPQLTTELRQSIDSVRSRYNATSCENRASSPGQCEVPASPLRFNCVSSDEGCESIAVAQPVAPAGGGAGGTDPAGSLTDPDPDPAELLLRNIKRDVEYQVSRITGEDPPVEFSSMDEARTHVQTLFPGIDFRILVNDKNLDGTPNLDRQYLVDNPQRIFAIDDHTMTYSGMPMFYHSQFIDTEYDPNEYVSEAKYKVKKMNLTDITDTYSSMTANNKKEIYCNNYTLNSESDEYIDPLLKLIYPDMKDTVTGNIMCPDDATSDGTPSPGPSFNNYTFPDGTYPNKNKLIIQIRNAIGDLRAIGLRGEVTDEAFGEDEIQSAPTRYNESLYLDDSDTKKSANEIAINIHSAQIPPPIVLRDGTTRPANMLIGLDGLSNRHGGILRNSPYNNNTEIDTTHNGRRDKYNSDNNAYQIYLKNVFWLQYYFARMFMGTDRYIPFNNYRQMFDPPVELIVDPNDNLIKYSDGSTFPNFDRAEMRALNNQSCRDSGTDYLLLTTIPMSLYDNAGSMSNNDVSLFFAVQDNNSGQNGIREIANGLFIVDGVLKKITVPEQFNRVITHAAGGAAGDPVAGDPVAGDPVAGDPVAGGAGDPAPTSQITESSFYEGDIDRYVPDGFGMDNICTTDNPYTLPNTGPSDEDTHNVRGDNCAFCLFGYCADNSKQDEIISRLTLRPTAPAPCIGTALGRYCEDEQATQDCWPHCKEHVDNPYDNQHDAQYRCENKYDTTTGRQCVYGWHTNSRMVEAGEAKDGHGCYSGNTCTLP